MANYNKVILVGNLTRDPELRTIPAGSQVCEFGLAMNRTWTTPSGEKKSEPTFVDISAWAKAAETIGKYMSKGDPILVEGRLQTRSWEGKDGKKQTKLSVVCERFQFLGRPSDGEKRAEARKPDNSGNWPDDPGSIPF